MSAPLVFESLTIENFGGYYGQSYVDFPIGSRNIMLIKGRNTGGKTSFLNAIKWCLYGEVDSRGVSPLSLIQLFNTVASSEGKESMRVGLEVKIKKEPYSIIRQAKRRFQNTRITSDNDFDIYFEVKKDGQILSEDLSRRIINQIAPKVISRFFLFDGELLKEYEELIDKRRGASAYPLVEAIEDVLGLPALKTGSDFLERSLTLAQESVSRIAKQSSGTASLSVLLDEATKDKDKILKVCHETEKKLDELERQKSVLETEVGKEREMYKLRGKIENNEEERKRVSIEVSNLKKKLRELSISSWHDCLSFSLEKEVEKISLNLNKLDSVYKDHIIDKNDLTRLKELLELRHCNICEQDVDDNHLITIQDRLEKIINVVKERETDYESIKNLDFQRKKIKSLINKVPAVYENYKVVQEQLYNEINNLYRLNDDYDRMQAEAGKENLDAVRKRREKLEWIIEEIGFLKKNIKNNKEKLSEKEQIINSYIERINSTEISGKIEAATQVKQKLENLKETFDLGRNILRERMRKHVEDYASRAYRAMIHESDHASVHISEKDYGLSIMDIEGNIVMEPSAGATQVLALSLIVALGKAGRPIGPIVMDSPFGRLDEEHRSRVLRYLPHQASQLILLYHSGELQPSTIHTIKSNVGSSYSIQKAQEGRSRLVKDEML